VSALLALVGFVGLCLLVGAAEAALSSRAVQGWYLSLTQPPGTPPAWVFGPIWTVLYIMIGVAGWMVWRHASGVRPLRLWGWQLAANAAWTPAFFGLHSPVLALAVSVVLLGLIVLTIRAFWRLCRPAGWLMLPYLAWSCYATYLSAGFWWMNPA
jgi:benzodiazapine receptor